MGICVSSTENSASARHPAFAAPGRCVDFAPNVATYTRSGPPGQPADPVAAIAVRGASSYEIVFLKTGCPNGTVLNTSETGTSGQCKSLNGVLTLAGQVFTDFDIR